MEVTLNKILIVQRLALRIYPHFRSIFISLDWNGLVADETHLGNLIHDGRKFNGNL
jgi:hypothetical protein